MALVIREGWLIAMSFKDDDGAVSRFQLHVYEPGVDLGYPVIQEFATRLIPRVQAVVDSTFQTMTVSKEIYEGDPLEKVPNAGSDVEDKGVFLLETADAAKGMVSVPGILESKLIATGALAGVAINLADADVLALVQWLTTDVDMNPFGFAGSVHATDSRGQEYVLVYDAYKQNRASFKSRGRRG